MAENPNRRPEPTPQTPREITRRGMLGAAGLAAGAAGLSSFVLTDTSQVASAAPARLPSPVPAPDLVLATDGSDQTAVLQNAINAAMAPGGSGRVHLAHNGRAVIKGQITFPNDGNSPPKQAPLLIAGQGSSSFGSVNYAPTNGTILDMQYPGTLTNAKIDTRGYGQLTGNADQRQDRYPRVRATHHRRSDIDGFDRW
jgi:hypothetical protein